MEIIISALYSDCLIKPFIIQTKKKKPLIEIGKILKNKNEQLIAIKEINNQFSAWTGDISTKNKKILYSCWDNFINLKVKTRKGSKILFFRNQAVNCLIKIETIKI